MVCWFASCLFCRMILVFLSTATDGTRFSYVFSQLPFFFLCTCLFWFSIVHLPRYKFLKEMKVVETMLCLPNWSDKQKYLFSLLLQLSCSMWTYIFSFVHYVILFVAFEVKYLFFLKCFFKNALELNWFDKFTVFQWWTIFPTIRLEADFEVLFVQYLCLIEFYKCNKKKSYWLSLSPLFLHLMYDPDL